MAFYSDKHSIFRVSAKYAARSERIIQFDRALAELNTDIVWPTYCRPKAGSNAHLSHCKTSW